MFCAEQGLSCSVRSTRVFIWCGWLLCMAGPRFNDRDKDLEREKGIRWMPWHQEAMKDVARCEKPWGAASRL
jgi:hypothetical protein